MFFSAFKPDLAMLKHSYGRTGWLQVLLRDGRVVKNILANMEMDWQFLRGEAGSVRLLGNK